MEKTDVSLNVHQSPAAGDHKVFYCGDVVHMTLFLSEEAQGQAFVRTNLGAASFLQKDIIRQVEKNEIRLNSAWYDIELEKKNNTVYEIFLPIYETGFFQAKCFFMPDGEDKPVWPKGDNTVLNVLPAGTCCANIIYNAFVRQFGPFKKSSDLPEETHDKIGSLDELGYTVIPSSGKFRDLIKELPFIFNELGCRVLHLLPVHPTPTTYARMGRFGSPYAALNFTEVDPALADFDPAATPLEQFIELVDEVHHLSGYLIMDIAINHTGWAAAIHESHPEWLDRGEDGKIINPGAWGVVWADLTKLDYSNKGLWQYMADVFLLWCHRGVDGFRCDAGYMIPVDAWEYMVAKVREKYPDTLFFLEGLGGDLAITRDILGRAGFTWAYSELFQNYTKHEIASYLPFSNETSNTCGHMIHFAETHDNNRLASVSTTYARMRTSLCALLSTCGGFGFANGVEWYAQKKINVHESPDLNWGSDDNQVAHIRRLNLILKHHPAFFANAKMDVIPDDSQECLLFARSSADGSSPVLIFINLDCSSSNAVSWELVSKNTAETGQEPNAYHDLLTGRKIEPEVKDNRCQLTLDAGEVLCLTQNIIDIQMLDRMDLAPAGMPRTALIQKYRSCALKIYAKIKGFGNVKDLDVEQLGLRLAEDPLETIRSLNPLTDESKVTVFDVTKDLKRNVMVPPDNFLLIVSPTGFRAELLEISEDQKTSFGYREGLIRRNTDGYFAVFPPLKFRRRHREIQISLRLYGPKGAEIETGNLLYLAVFDTLLMRTAFTRKEIYSTPYLKLMSATNRGGMMRAAASWGRLDSRYDGLLCANIHPKIPEDRWMTLARCRIWAIYQGYSRELALDCLEAFWFSYDHGGKWRFQVPTSEGRYYVLDLFATLHPQKNHIRLMVRRVRAKEGPENLLDDKKPVQLIFRPDIEDRSFHETVKAYQGPEFQWPEKVRCFENGFDFTLSRDRVLTVKLSKGWFIHEPEWKYMVHHPVESSRGLDDASDLYSPGFFRVNCWGGDAVRLDAGVCEEKMKNRRVRFPRPKFSFKKDWSVKQALEEALEAFFVSRGKDASVIAGYPWFLDWGRDSLIYCRALIQLGRLESAAAVIRQFGRFESGGTLPNMICGDDARNIETSDAPLWFFACCRDLVEKQGSATFLDQDLDGRTVKDVLLSIAENLIKGTRTGVVMDPETCLIYSPAHFTWMDTNFPAGTPRQGYPVEIQALWCNALGFLAEIDDTQAWQKMADTVKSSVDRLFWRENNRFYADCLHCNGPDGALNAAVDDALRPNQLFLVTMGCVASSKKAMACVETCQELLVPGGIRSLADRRVEYPLYIVRDGVRLKDPHTPYTGVYEGDEDTKRKPAYHNGTAWSWPFPVFCEAWAQVFGEKSFNGCLAWLGSVISLMRSGAAGFVPEIMDGDYPHTARGCDAQAWGVSEAVRVMDKLGAK